MRKILTLLTCLFFYATTAYAQLGDQGGIHGGGGGTSSTSVSGKVCKTVTNPSDSDNLLFDIASARTVTKLWGICIGGTSVAITLQNPSDFPNVVRGVLSQLVNNA